MCVKQSTYEIHISSATRLFGLSTTLGKNNQKMTHFLKLFLPIFALSKLHKNCVQNFFDNLINKLYRFEPVARTLNLGRTMSTMPTQNLMSLKKIVAEKCL